METTIIRSRSFAIWLLLLAFSQSKAQTIVSWSSVETNVEGNIGAGTLVTVTPDSGLLVSAPAMSTVNLNVSSNIETFTSAGPYTMTFGSLPLSLDFSFTQPVVITRFTVADIDEETDDDPDVSPDIFYDGFSLSSGVDFDDVDPTGCNAGTGGCAANSVHEGGLNLQYADWFCSGQTSGFTMFFTLLSDGRTTAGLTYSMEVVPVPQMPVACLGSQVNFPVIGNNIEGTWSPNSIDTGEVGTDYYTFTPNEGQALTCPITIDVTVADCPCLPNATLSSGNNDDMDNNDLDAITYVEREFWISASNKIGVGNNNFQDGVIYHAADFVYLTPGFVEKPISVTTQTSGRPKIFNMAVGQDSGILKVAVGDRKMTSLAVYSIDGRMVFQKQRFESNSATVDISRFPSGLYIVNVVSDLNETFSQKFIKN